ncbi:hypothetical protein HGRIS_001423 [Hohenbuehelia grisea]|uniref:Uncharacterized protein n=1 Tax=Hohenbuehelia grisea TaxID=104357 RepID=A0ABR3JRF9_9AGAR
MKEMDRKFSEALDSLTWDVEGELIMTLTICAFRSAIQNLHHGGARDLQPPRVEFHSDIPGSLLLMVSQVNWHLYSKVISGVVDILNLSSKHLDELANLVVDPIPIPSFDDEAQDSD